MKTTKTMIAVVLLCSALGGAAFAVGPLTLIDTIEVDPEDVAGAVDGCEFSKDGKYFAASDNHGVARIYRTADRSLVGKVTHKYHDHTGADKNYELNAVVWSHDGKYLATGRNDDGVKVWKTDSFFNPADFATNDAPYQHLVNGTEYDGADFSPNNLWLAAAADEYLKVFRLSDFTEIESISTGGGAVNTVDFLPDSSLVAFGSSGNIVLVARTSDWTVVNTIKTGSDSSVKSVRFSPDGQYLAISGKSVKCSAYKTSDWSQVVNITHLGNQTPLPGDDQDTNPAVEAVEWSEDSAYMLSSGKISGVMHVWDVSAWPSSGSVNLDTNDAVQLIQAQEADRQIEFIYVFENKVIVGGDEGNVRMYKFSSAVSPKQASSARSSIGIKKMTAGDIGLELLLPLKGSSQEYVEFDPTPLLLLKASEAAEISSIVAAGPFAESYKSLMSDADALLDDRPNPLENIIYEGRVSNHPDRLNSVKHLRDMTKIYTLTWACFVSGKSTYGAKAIEFVEAWAKKYKASGNDVNDNKILACMISYQVLKNQMSESQKTTIGKWIKTIGDALKKGWKDQGGNHVAKRLKLIYFAAYLDDDQGRIDWVQEKIQVVWNATLYENGETHDFRRRDAVHYHMSSIVEFLQIARIGRLLGKDHYNQKADNGGSIARAIDFVMPFIKGEKIHPEWVNSRTKLDHQKWQAGDPYYKPGKPWDPWEAYESLLLASAFDNSLHHWAEKLRQGKNKPLPWFAVLARASRTDDLNSSHAVQIIQAQELDRQIEFIDVIENQVIVGGDEGNVRLYEFPSDGP